MLGGTRAGDQELLDIAHSFRSLTTLYLSRTRVTDRGVRRLGSLKDLEVLWLDGTKISDNSLDALGQSTALREVRVDGTRVTAAGIGRLRRRLPRVKINGRFTEMDDGASLEKEDAHP